MISTKFYRKQFIIAAGSVIACLLLGSSVLSLVLRLTLDSNMAKFQPPSLFRNLVEREGAGDLVLGLKKAERLLGPDEPVRLYLLDEKGRPIYPATAPVPPGTTLPEKIHESLPAVPPRFMGPGPGSVPMITRLDHEPARYLVLEMGFGPGHPPGAGRFPEPPGGRLFFPFSLLVMAVMLLVGIGTGLWIIFRSLRTTARQADEVISALKSGNLKARFPIQRHDEIGQAMKRFNSMADEIESLVERLRTAENSRDHLLQELTHDLRTPVASLKTMLEGIFHAIELTGDVREMSELSLSEVEYLERLVEDLLLLARLTEPRYKVSAGFVDLLSLLEQESEALAYKNEERIRVVSRFHVDEALIAGDEHLFQRLVRNSLENAFAHARSAVEIEVDRGDGGEIRVRVTDDGDGFSREDLAKFGERRDHRTVQKTRGGKVSLGLGSVIMKSVVSLHGGRLRAGNSPGGGGVIEFSLPGGPHQA